MSACPPAARVRAPAKVNLHLGVGPPRPDGFHDLVTIFHAVDLADVITVHPAAALSVRLRGLGASELPTGPDNLAWAAAQLLGHHAGLEPDVAIEIDKAIPVAGGLAGGSADAAGALLACARLWNVDTAALPGLGARLGSDVPFALLGGTAVGTGRGEVLEPLPPGPGELHWVLALAGFGISTATAYAELDRLRAHGLAPPPALDVAPLRAALAAGDPARVAAALHNDLQPAALSLAPSLRAVLDAGRCAGALGGVVSGSGPTCAFLCADADHARAVDAELRRRDPARATRVARGPAPGAAVLADPANQ